MALLTVEDYEVASGGFELSDADTARCQYYIDFLSDYLEHRTGITFTTIVGQVTRMRADDYGEILFDDYPVTDVTNIHDVKGDYDFTGPSDYWDGLSTLQGLYPRQVVDVTFNCGLDPVGRDIRGVAIEAVKRGMATTPTGLTKKTVGDVSYEYGDMLSFSMKDEEIVGLYEQTEGCMRLQERPGTSGYPSYYGLPLANGNWDSYGDCL